MTNSKREEVIDRIRNDKGRGLTITVRVSEQPSPMDDPEVADKAIGLKVATEIDDGKEITELPMPIQVTSMLILKAFNDVANMIQQAVGVGDMIETHDIEPPTSNAIN